MRLPVGGATGLGSRVTTLSTKEPAFAILQGQKWATSDIQKGEGRKACDPHQLHSFASYLRSQTLPGDKVTLCSCPPGSHRPGGDPWELEGGDREEIPQKGYWPGTISRAQPAKSGFSQGLQIRGFEKVQKQLSVRMDLLISKKSVSKRNNCRSAVLYQPDTSNRPEAVRSV